MAEHRDRTFLLFEDADQSVSEWSYGEFDQAIVRVADRLHELGVMPGTAVHIVLRNCPAFIAVWLACARLGAWIVPVDPISAARDIGRQVDRVRPVVGIYAHERRNAYLEGLAMSGARSTRSEPRLIELSETTVDLSHNSPLCGTALRTILPRARPEQRLAVMFTSGTTSEPKGVVLTQHNYANVADSMSAVIGLQPQHRWLVTLPLFHANAQYYCISPAIAVGGSVALTATFSASQWLRQAAELSATHASLFAAPMRMILARRPSEPPPVKLEHLWYAQNLGTQHYDEFASLIGCRPRQLYGMTETVAIVSADVSQPYRNDLIGRPLAGRQVVLENPLSGAPAEPGEPGELVLAGTPGEDIFLEYLNDPVVTAKSLIERDGVIFFHTGDLVQEDADTGALRFVGRCDDVIKVSGENVSLTEIEAVLAQAPGVLECAVVGQPDPVRDVVPVAYVVARDPADPPSMTELADWAAVNLAPAARPRDWHLIGELPRTSVGKVRRFKLDG